jgi:hypothetical protein
MPSASEGGGKRVAIVQSSYIPWKGYFDLINSVDEFILYDSVQFTRRDWRNRNRIKTRDGPLWLSIPVEVKGRYHQTIEDTRVSHPGWARRHLETIRHAYARAAAFAEYEPRLRALYESATSDRLSAINEHFLVGLCRLLGISTRITRSSEYHLVEGRNERLIALCQQAGARRYLSGPSARAYLDEARFIEAGIIVEWMSYEGYPEYPQLFPPFDHHVSVLDLLLNVGDRARASMLSFAESSGGADRGWRLRAPSRRCQP